METGIVIKIIDNKRALVSVQPSVECDTCKSSGSCHKMDTKSKEIEVQYEGSIQEGDRVEVNIEPSYRIISSMIVFLVPILFLIAGYFGGKSLFKNEDLAILSSVAGLALSFGMLFVFFQGSKRIRNHLPKAFPLETNTDPQTH